MLLREVLELHSGILCAAVISPRHVLFVQGLAEGTNIGRRDGATAGNPPLIDLAVWEKAGGVVVDHVEVSRFALGVGVGWERFQGIPDRLETGLAGIEA